MPDTITLTQKQLKFYVHLGATVPLDEMEPGNAHTCRQVGLFFSVNAHLAQYAVDIEHLTLTPQAGDGTPPLAVVRINRKRRSYRLTSNGEGLVPDLPRLRRRRA